jgi:hypothetical protein
MPDLLKLWAELAQRERELTAMSDAAAADGTRKNQRNRLFIAIERLRRAKLAVQRAI